MEHFLFAGDLRHRDRNAGIDVANNKAHLIPFDQFPGLLHAGADIICRVFNQELDGPAQNAALLVDLLSGEFCSHHLSLCDRGIDSGQGIDHSDAHRRFAPRFNDEG